MGGLAADYYDVGMLHTAVFIYLLGTRSLGSNFDLNNHVKVRCWHEACGALASPHRLTLG
jgi:hypothetical protein